LQFHQPIVKTSFTLDMAIPLSKVHLQ
jgi:hypothetical protein